MYIYIYLYVYICIYIYKRGVAPLGGLSGIRLVNNHFLSWMILQVYQNSMHIWHIRSLQLPLSLMLWLCFGDLFEDSVIGIEYGNVR